MKTVKNERGLFCIAGIIAVVAGTVSLLGAPAIAGEKPVYAVGSVVLEGDDTAYLGVQLREETDHAEGGARVTHVVEDSPADEAGIRDGDIIFGFDGEVIRGPVSLTQRIHSRKPGDAVSVAVIRDGEKQRLEVELGSRPDPLGVARMKLEDVYTLRDDGKWQAALEDYQERMSELGERLGRQYGDWSRSAPSFSWSVGAGKPKLGVQLVETTPELRDHLGGDEDEGVLVSKVLAGTPAERAGISVGDLIVSVDGEPVASTGELIGALADKDGETFPVGLIRDRREITLEVTIEEPEDPVPTGPRAFLMPVPPEPHHPAPRVPAMREPLPPMPPLPPAAPLPPAPPERVLSRIRTSV